MSLDTEQRSLTYPYIQDNILSTIRRKKTIPSSAGLIAAHAASPTPGPRNIFTRLHSAWLLARQPPYTYHHNQDSIHWSSQPQVFSFVVCWRQFAKIHIFQGFLSFLSVFCHFWLVSTIFSCFSSIFDCFAAIHLQCLPIGRTWPSYAYGSLEEGRQQYSSPPVHSVSV